MPLVTDLSESQLAFQVSGGAVDQFQVIRYRGSEGLCQLYRFEIELATAETSTSFDDIVGNSAVLSVNTPEGERWFHGVVSRLEVTDQTHDLTYFRIELVPALWTLTHRYNSRIFQEMSVKDIITDILTKGGIPSDRFRFETSERGEDQRTYCVQYRETDYNFIARLMEEEGIWWCFEQSAESHVLVMADDPAAYAAIEGEAEMPFVPPSGMNTQVEHVYRFRLGQAVRPGAVVLNDFNFEDPKLDLKSSADCGRDSMLEFFDYPGEYREQGAGGSLATLRSEEFESQRIMGYGYSNSRRLAPGKTFDLIEHPTEGLNRSYLVTAVTHQGKQAVARTSTGALGGLSLLSSRLMNSINVARQHENESIRELAEALAQIAARLGAGDQTANRALSHWLYHAGQVSRDMGSIAGAAGGNPFDGLTIPNLIDDIAKTNIMDLDAPVYECRFACIPSSVTYRPPRVTPWPVMRGTQTARVVGPEGQEIHTDEYGRVKVQFNWDREGEFNENSSCWIRVSQGFAGGGYGMMFLPRIGQEVIVDFLEGNPDDPIIVGRVYNADHMPPYTLPDEKTKSVIKSRSSIGGEGSNEIRFEDLKGSEQMLLYTEKDMHQRVQNTRVQTIAADENLSVGNNRNEEVTKDYSLKVKENLKEEIGIDKSLKVDGKVSIKIANSETVDVGGDLVEKVGMNHKHDVSMTYACKALAIKLEGSTGIELVCGGSSIVLTPGAIFIQSGIVNINSGSGPPVGPVTAMATSPEAPEAPAAADEVEHGTDTTYAGGEEPEAAEIPAEVEGHDWEPEEVEQEISWISIELVDENDNPVAGERYEITCPDGKTILKGSLDSSGRVRRSVPGTGTCQISFPDLDAAAWERI